MNHPLKGPSPAIRVRHLRSTQLGEKQKSRVLLAWLRGEPRVAMNRSFRSMTRWWQNCAPNSSSWFRAARSPRSLSRTTWRRRSGFADRIFLLSGSPAHVLRDVPIERLRIARRAEEIAAIRSTIELRVDHG